MDDLGYGDVSSYGVGTLLRQILIEFLKNGIRFTNKDIQLQRKMEYLVECIRRIFGEIKENEFLPGNAPLLFDLSKETLPYLYWEKANYKTAIIGKFIWVLVMKI